MNEYIRVPKRPLIVLSTIITFIVVVWAFWPEAQMVEMAIVRQDSFERTITDEGVTRYKDKRIIMAPRDGVLPHLNWEPGDFIEKGKLLFVLMSDSDRSVFAPMSGYILKVYEKDQRHVVRGTPILEIGSPQQLEIMSSYLTKMAIDIQVGQKVLIKNWGGPSILEGKVKVVEPSAKEEISALGVKEQRVNVIIELTSPKELWRKLGDAYRVETNVIVSVIPSATVLPLGALFETEKGPAVYVVNSQNQIETRTLQLGPRNRDFAVVVSGLTVGEKIVMYPDNRLKEKMKVKAQFSN